MKNKKTYSLVLAAMLTAVGLILPYVSAHAFGMRGTVFLPMHIPVFLIGFLCGPQYGAIGGILIPVLSSVLTGMPMYPVLAYMTGELFTYGLLSGLLYKKARLPLYPALLISMICGRVVYGLVFAAIMGISMDAITAVSGAVVQGLVGIIIQLILLPVIVTVVNKYFFHTISEEPARECDTLNHAIQLIRNNKASCVVIKNGRIIYSAIGPGVRPLIELYENNPDILKGGFVVDKVIGKAAAMILTLGGASKAYGLLMSTAAKTYLDEHGIPNDSGRCVEIISNRKGDGMCPMEQAVMDTDDAETAYHLLKETIQRLMNVV